MTKYLAYVLRHNPGELGITLDAQGWTPIAELLERMGMTRTQLQELVDADKKGRFSIRDERIRANQGHSVKGVLAVDLIALQPPDQLYHGTTKERWVQIQATGGLKPGQRHHVHLSAEEATAREVGSRHRREGLQILRVDSRLMHEQGLPFFRSENGVWMVDAVPLEFLSAIP